MSGIKRSKRLLFLLNRALTLAGIKLKRVNAATRYWPEGLSNMRRQGFVPEVIVDVGVLGGTWELYEAYREARLILVEAMPSYEPQLQEIARCFSARYHLVAAGAVEGSVEFTHRVDNPGASSMFSGGVGRVETITVPMRRLDTLLAPEDLGSSALLKVDVEGYELDVIEGAVGLLERFEVVILETRFFKYAEGMTEFHEVIARMYALGFVVYDFFDGYYRPQDAVLDLIDIVFVRKAGLLRQRLAAGHGRHGAA